MTATELSVTAVNGALADAVDLLAQLPLDALEPGHGACLLTELCRLSNRLNGEIARVASVVSASGEWVSSGANSAAAFMSNTTGIAWGHAKAAIDLGDAIATQPALDDAVRSGVLTPAAAAKVLPALGDDGFSDVAVDLIGELCGMTPTKAARHNRRMANGREPFRRRRPAQQGPPRPHPETHPAR